MTFGPPTYQQSIDMQSYMRAATVFGGNGEAIPPFLYDSHIGNPSFEMPPTNADNEHESLERHAESYRDAKKPDPKPTHGLTQEELISLSPNWHRSKCSHPLVDFDMEFEKAVDSVAAKSSTGCSKQLGTA